jgi:YtoQ family protein
VETFIMDPLQWRIYLAGETLSAWREDIVAACEKASVAAVFLGPVTDHAKRDAVEDRLGAPPADRDRDSGAAKLDAMRFQVLLEAADVVLVRVDQDAPSWTAAFEAGQASALGTPVIAFHDPGLEDAQAIDARALAVVHSVDQVVEVLRYVTEGGVIGRKKRSAGFGPGTTV